MLGAWKLATLVEVTTGATFSWQFCATWPDLVDVGDFKESPKPRRQAL